MKLIIILAILTLTACASGGDDAFFKKLTPEVGRELNR